MQNTTDGAASMDQPLPLWLILLIPIYIGGFFAIFLFPLAKDWRWLEGWALTITIAINVGISYFIINQKNPRVIRNRAKIKKEGLTDATREPAGSDRFILPMMGVGAFGALVVAALGRRFGWPAIPPALEIAGLVLSNIGLIIMNIATLQNAYASKLLDIKKEQVLIDSGLYAHVRHPLYAGGILMFLGLPIALGSWWGLLLAALAALALVMRIEAEEAMLIQGMDGYRDYQQRVRYKLIPKIY